MKILFISLGCDKNLVDSEKMLADLCSRGHEITDIDEEAEAVVINTCCFIHDAKQESIEAILSAAELKKTAKLKYLIAAGCLAQRYKEEILNEITEVDAIIGTTAGDMLADVLDSLAGGDRSGSLTVMPPDRNPVFHNGRKLSGINRYSYLKISEGCDKHCTYCVIPSIRGNYRSEKFETLIAEAEELAAAGINELTVIGQETTLYGTDLYGRKRLPELLKALCAIDGIEHIRLMYCYPEEIDDELISTMAQESKICKYIDLPIQHAADSVLKRMGRRTDRAQITDIIGRLRKAMPGIAIRTSLITGFPGETEEEHEELLDFIRTMKLERVGVFTYSKEENTPAGKMKNQIPARVKQKRRKELMLAQQECSFEHNRSMCGSTLEIIVDGRLPEDGVYVGRSYMDAPGIDSCVFFSSDRDLISGDSVNVRITGTDGYDLVGEEE